MLARSAGPRPLTSFVLIACILLAACGAPDQRDDSQSAPGSDGDLFSLELAGSIPDFGADTSAANRRPGIIAGYNAAMLSADVAAVANYDHVLLYDFSSNASRSIGRKGDGPGEFRTLNNVLNAESGFMVVDNNSRRVILFRSTGEYIRNLAVAPGTTIGWLSGIGPVARRGGFENPPYYSRHDTAGKLVRELVRMPAPTNLMITTVTADHVTYTSMDPACDPPILAATVGGKLFVADQKAGTVLAVAADGESRQIFMSPRKGRITPRVIEKVEGSFSGATPAAKDSLLRRFGAVGDSLLITWDKMIADPTGRLLLRLSECVNEKERLWEVIDTNGTQRGSFRSPLHVIAAWGESLLVRGEDSTGTPELSRYKLVPR